MPAEIRVEDAVREPRPDLAVPAEGPVDGGDETSAGPGPDGGGVDDPHVPARRDARRGLGTEPQCARPSVDAAVRLRTIAPEARLRVRPIGADRW